MSTNVTSPLAALLVIWLVAKLGGEVMERVGQPAVLGELLAGVLIGPGVLGLVGMITTFIVPPWLKAFTTARDVSGNSDIAALPEIVDPDATP